MVLCKRKRVASIVQKQFENRLVGKTYLAKVHGHPSADKLLCEASIAREAGDGGIYLIDPDGHEASTAFEFCNVSKTALPSSELSRAPVARIRSAPTCASGIPDRWRPGVSARATARFKSYAASAEPPMCLHSESIVFRDADRKELKFEAPAPEWAAH